MTDWRLQPGTVLIEIHGVCMLAADKDARKLCGFVRRVNKTGAFFWRQLSEGRDRREILAAMQREYEIPEESDPEKDLDLFIRSLREHRYIVDEAEKVEI